MAGRGCDARPPVFVITCTAAPAAVRLSGEPPLSADANRESPQDARAEARRQRVAAALVAVAGLLAVARIEAAPAGTAGSRGEIEAAARLAFPAAAPLGWALLDGFEDAPWPDTGLWRLPADTAPMWWPSTCRAKTGRRALWAFGGPGIGGEVPCTYAAPAGTLNTLYMLLDLRDTALASRMDLFFELWLRMPEGEDGGLFIFLHVPQDGGPALRVPVFGGTGTSGEWSYPARRLDLLALTDIESPDRVFDLRGRSWVLEWTALAPRGVPPGGGIYLDDIVLVWEPDPAVPTPTRRPTSAPSATTRPSTTPTAPPSPTPTATVAWTRTPTRRPPISFRTIHLPVLRNEVVVEPTPAITATGTATPEASSTPTLSAVLYLPWAEREVEPAPTFTATAVPATEPASPEPTLLPEPPTSTPGARLGGRRAPR